MILFLTSSLSLSYCHVVCTDCDLGNQILQVDGIQEKSMPDTTLSQKRSVAKSILGIRNHQRDFRKCDCGLAVTLIGCGIHDGVYPLRPKAKIIPSSTELLPVQYLAIGMREVIPAGL